MRKQPRAERRAPGKSRIATLCWSTCATRSKPRWQATKARCQCWKERGKRRSLPPSTRSSCRKSQACLWNHLRSTSERRASKTLDHAPQNRTRSQLPRGVGRSAGPIVWPALSRSSPCIAKDSESRAIARQLHGSRKVVHRSVTAGTFPERTPTGKRQRWEQGCHNGSQLAREIQAQGFRGAASLVRKLTGDWRARLPGPAERVRGKKRQAAPPVKRC